MQRIVYPMNSYGYDFQKSYFGRRTVVFGVAVNLWCWMGDG